MHDVPAGQTTDPSARDTGADAEATPAPESDPIVLPGAGGPVGGPIAGEVVDALNQPLGEPLPAPDDSPPS
jgi:hypothetical protein